MAENPLDRYVAEANIIRNKLTEKDVPRQKDAIENLTTATLEEKLGPELFKLISEAYAGNPDLSTHTILQLTTRLRGRQSLFSKFLDEDTKRQIRERGIDSVSKYQIREIHLTENNQSKVWLARKSTEFEGRLERLDLFEVPDNTSPDTLELPYKGYYITDRQTGKTANLLDVLSPSTITSYQVPVLESLDLRSNYYLPADDRLSIGETTEQGVYFTPIISLHESGHSHQSPGLHKSVTKSHWRAAKDYLATLYYTWKNNHNFSPPQLSQELSSDVIKERNAVAFSLAAVRKYRQLGVDLLPGLSNKQVVKFCNRYMQRRDENVNIKTRLKFNKMKPET